MRAAEFDFVLPDELIAQTPAARRDQARLLVWRRQTQHAEHRSISDLPQLLRAGDLLVYNDSRVIPARLRARNPKTGGEFEILLLEENVVNDWWAMMRPGKRARIGLELVLLRHDGSPCGVIARVTAQNPEGHRCLSFSGTENVRTLLGEIGEMPLPPYITRAPGASTPGDRERYQTIYARADGSVAAPTAGLHFTVELLKRLERSGISRTPVTLHVGLGTFAPVKAEDLSAHVMHEERYNITPETAQLIEAARREKRRIIAVGTTTLRVLESVAQAHAGAVVPGADRTRLFVRPPFRFQVVDQLLTNFHLPRSTLLMLTSAFVAPEQTSGVQTLLELYRVAVNERYRFFSYGDAMLIG